MEIICNNVPRQPVYGCELTAAERADFDYIDDIDTAEFVRYRGGLWSMADFMCTDGPDSPFDGWDGYAPSGFSFGLVLRYPRDEYGRLDVGAGVIIGRYIG